MVYYVHAQFILPKRRKRVNGGIFFVDAAPTLSAVNPLRLRVGVVGGMGYYKSYLCPKWISGLQQAELFALYIGAKIAAYWQQKMVFLGTDSGVAIG